MKNIRLALQACLVTLLFVANGAFAATVTVTNLNDSGAGSLRDRIAAAGAGGTVLFNAGLTGTITLVTELAIVQSVTIQGPGVSRITIAGAPATRSFNITAGTLTVSGLTIANGTTPALGAGVLVGGGGLEATNVVFTTNTAANGGGVSVAAGATADIDQSTFSGNTAVGVGGGALIVFGTVAVTRSTFEGNTAAVNGGAINVQPGGILTVVNSTFVNNTSGGLGGAVTSLGVLTLSSTTFFGNQGTGGGAFATGNNTYTIDNSVFVNNVATGAGGGGAINPFPVGGTVRNNVFFNNTAAGVPDDAAGYGSTAFVVATSNPLGAFGNYGGPTQTMAPRTNGAAICAGNAAFLPPGTNTDQIGGPRTAGGCLNAGAVQAALAGTQQVPTLSTTFLILLASLMGIMAMTTRGRSFFRA